MIELKYPTIEQLEVRLKNMTKEDTLSYDKSYDAFLRYFSSKDVITEDDLIISSNFTYGWMPTILNFKDTNFSECVEILNKSKTVDRLEKYEIEALKRLINNSLVGSSKLLHFINPEKYAIWDSRVCNFLSGSTSKHFIEKSEIFFEYLDICLEVIGNDKYETLIYQPYMQIMNNKNASKMKSIEQIMFLNSNNGI